MNDREHQHDTDSVDLFTAFAIGAMIGVGATLLLRPDPPTAGDRIRERFSPLAKRAQKAARRAGRQYRKSLAHSRDATRDLGRTGKNMLEDLRTEVEEILSDARHQLADSARKQIRSARKGLGHRLQD